MPNNNNEYWIIIFIHKSFKNNILVGMIVGDNIKGKKEKDNIWIISDGRLINLDLSNICEEPVSGPVTEYRLSELGRYLLNPNQITLDERVIGCKVRYHKPRSGKIMLLIKKLFEKKNASPDSDNPFIEEIISTSKIGDPTFQDEDLNAHFIKIIEMLRPYDPVQKKLARMDREKIDDISAMCGEIGSSRFLLNLQGNTNEKINFMANSMSKKMKVVFNKAYLLNGLFEMRGFDFALFNNVNNNYRLIKFTQNDKIRHCVLNSNCKFEFWVNDNILVNYMHLFEQSIKTDPKLREALGLCVKGDAKPLKLFFSNQLDQKYSEKYLPVTYREMFNAYDINPNEKNTITNILNNYQSIVSFNYVPKSGTEKQKLFTNISVMHDFRALEPIKSKLPRLYSEIDKKASVSDAGKLYLLDSIRGYQNV